MIRRAIAWVTAIGMTLSGAALLASPGQAAAPGYGVWLPSRSSPVAGQALSLRSVVAPDGRVSMVWIASGKVWASDRAPFAEPSAPTLISGSLPDPTMSSAWLSADAAGNQLAVWAFKTPTEAGLYAAYRPAGGSWQAPAEVTRWTGTQTSGIDVEPDGAGGFYVANDQDWTGGHGRAALSRFTPNGGWQPQVFLVGADSDKPMIEINPANGTGVVAWETRTAPKVVEARTIGVAAEQARPTPPGTQAEFAGALTMAPDGSMMLMTRYGSGTIRSQRWAPGGGWQPLQIAVNSPNSIAEMSAIATPTENTLVLVSRSGTDYQHVAMTRPHAGAGTWSAPVAISPVEANVVTPNLSASPDGTVYVSSFKMAGHRVVAKAPGGAWGTATVVTTDGVSVPMLGFDQFGNGVMTDLVPGAYFPRFTEFDVTAPEITDVVAPATVVTGTAGTFTAASRDLSSRTLTTTWDFGDGTTGTGANASHSYTAAGTYAVTAMVTDQAGRTATATRSVTVAAAPAATPGPNTPTGPTGPSTGTPGTTDPTIDPTTGLPRVPVILAKKTLTFDLDLAPTAAACPTSSQLKIKAVLKSKAGSKGGKKTSTKKRKVSYKVSKRGFTVIVDKIGSVCRVSGSANLTKKPGKGKLTVTLSSKATKKFSVVALTKRS